MADLRQDLLNSLGNEKYYDEIELVRLAQDPNTPYKEKVNKMVEILKNIQALDFASQLVGKYFQEAAPQQPQGEMPPQQPQGSMGGQPQPGQTHAE